MTFKQLIKKHLTLTTAGEKKPIYMTAIPAPVAMQNAIHSSQEDELYKMLKTSGRQLLLYGDGGTGKTHMARNLFYRLQKDYRRFAWVEYNTDMKSSLLAAFNTLDDESNINVRFSKIIEQLTEDPERTILFIDDAKETAANDDVLARITGLGISIFITSRCKSIPPYVAYKIASISEENCIELFYAHYPYDQNRRQIVTVRKLVNLLHCNAMSIIMLARVIGTEKNLKRYHQILKLESKGFSESSYQLLKKNIKYLLKMANLSNEQYRLLQCFAFMPSGEIPAKISLWFNLKQEDFDYLTLTGWLTENKEQKTYILHDLIREYLQEQGLPEDIFTQLLYYIFKDKTVDGETEDFHYKLKIIEHALNVTSDSNSLYAAGCLWLGNAYHNLNKYSNALLHYQNALQSELKKEQPDPEILLEIHFDMGRTFAENSMYEEALENYQTAEKYLNDIGEINVQHLAAIKNNIGNIYLDLGNYTKALTYYQETMKTYKQTTDQDPRRIAGYYNNIGSVYNLMGDYTKALTYYQKALKIQKQALGMNHPDIAGSYDNMGTVYYVLGNYEKALQYHEKALEINKQHLGTCHPDTLNSYNNIGNIYYTLGQYTKALEYHQKVLTIREQVFGINHPESANSYNNIGSVYHSLGDYTKALEYFQKALEIREQILGIKHPDTLGSYNNIGNAFHSLGNYEKALAYHQKALELRELVIGINHLDTAESYGNIGSVYHALNNDEKALQYCQKSISIREQLLGYKHPITANSYNNIGEIWYDKGDYQKALAYHQKALYIRNNVFGSNHIETSESYNNLGMVFFSLGEITKALEYVQKTLSIQKEKLPKNHPYIATTYLHLSDIFATSGDQEESLRNGLNAYIVNFEHFGKNGSKTKDTEQIIRERYQKWYPNQDFDAWFQNEFNLLIEG